MVVPDIGEGAMEPHRLHGLEAASFDLGDNLRASCYHAPII
jgi:hypothetical protein